MLIELTSNPINDVFFIDPLFREIALNLDHSMDIYDQASYQLQISGVLIYVFLYTFYGYAIDFCWKQFRKGSVEDW